MANAETLRRTELSYQDLRCTDAAAAAFGVTTVEAHDGLVVASAIREQTGRGYDPVMDYTTPPTLARFISDHGTGDFLLVTAGHCMALRDGALTDTDLNAGSRRRILGALRIS